MKASLAPNPIFLTLSSICLAFGISSQAHASIQKLNFSDAADLALKRNLGLAALRAQSEALKQHSKEALSPESPVLILGRNNTPVFKLGATPASQVVGANWNLGFPGKAFVQSAKIEHQAYAVRDQAFFRELEILTELSTNFSSLFVVDEILKMLLEEQKKSRDLVQFIEKRYSLAQAAQVDVLNARATLGGLEHEILVTQGQKQALLIEFKNLILNPEPSDLEPDVSKQIDEPEIAFDTEQLLKFAIHSHPMLLSAKENSAAANSNLTAANLSALPDFQLSVATTFYNVPSAEAITGVTRDYSFGVGITIPLFFPFKELSGIAAARRERDAAENSEYGSLQEIKSSILKTYQKFKTLKLETVNLQKYVVTAYKSSYELNLKAYTQGRSDYLRLKESRTGWITAQRSLLSAKGELFKTFSDLVLSVGCDFSKTDTAHSCHE